MSPVKSPTFGTRVRSDGHKFAAGNEASNQAVRPSVDCGCCGWRADLARLRRRVDRVRAVHGSRGLQIEDLHASEDALGLAPIIGHSRRARIWCVLAQS